MTEQNKIATIRMLVRAFYDMQKLRIQSGNRTSKGVTTVQLTAEDKEALGKLSDSLKSVEDSVLAEIKPRLKGIPIYEHWLSKQRGVGPTMAALLVTHIHIDRCDTASKLWRWCGLAVIDGQAERRKKGEKAHFDPWLKSKVLAVLGGCLLKAGAPLEEATTDSGRSRKARAASIWFKTYQDYKHRKETQLVEQCMGCGGTGKMQLKEKAEPGKPREGKTKQVVCYNCEGKPGPQPWGRSAAHRHQAALRYMVKQFLLQLYLEWRKLEGLPVRDPYAVEKLHMAPHMLPVAGTAVQTDEELEVEEMVAAELAAANE